MKDEAPSKITELEFQLVNVLLLKEKLDFVLVIEVQ